MYLRRLDHTDRDEVAALLGRGMADNPMHIEVYGSNEAARARKHERIMRTLLTHSPSMRIDGIAQHGSLVGVAASTPAGLCQTGSAARLRLVSRAATLGLRSATRLVRWNRAWASEDISELHVHLGPVSIDRHLRGRGIGNVLMLRHVDSLDSQGATGYLETDRPEAVGFYRRYGYAVIVQKEILGVPCWFMRRPSA